MRSFTESVASALSLRPKRRKLLGMCPVKIEPSSPRNQNEAMRADFEAVGRDIRFAIQQHGEASK